MSRKRGSKVYLWSQFICGEKIKIFKQNVQNLEKNVICCFKIYSFVLRRKQLRNCSTDFVLKVQNVTTLELQMVLMCWFYIISTDLQFCSVYENTTVTLGACCTKLYEAGISLRPPPPTKKNAFWSWISHLNSKICKSSSNFSQQGGSMTLT